MAAPSFAEYGPRIEESVRTLAATLAARRQAGATASNEDLAALADEALTAAGAPKQATIPSGDADESGLERWRVEAMQAALTRALEVVVEEQVCQSLCAHRGIPSCADGLYYLCRLRSRKLLPTRIRWPTAWTSFSPPPNSVGLPSRALAFELSS